MNMDMGKYQDQFTDFTTVAHFSRSVKTMPDPITQTKREQLLTFIDRKLKPAKCVRGVVGIGSIATGNMRPDSDIDAIIFMDPVDLYIAPAEAIWVPTDDSFHSIFIDNNTVHESAMQLDFKRVSLNQWVDPDYPLDDGYRAELAEGWIAFDRDGDVADLVAARTAYRDELRIRRLDEAIIGMEGHIKWDEPATLWDSLGPARAHDRLSAAYRYLVQSLFAYNRRWCGWRNREMSYLLKLPWLPENFEERGLVALNAPSLDLEGFTARFEMLNTLLDELLARLVADGDYGEEPIDEAFIRLHDEPGRAWNMEAWEKQHRPMNPL